MLGYYVFPFLVGIFYGCAGLIGTAFGLLHPEYGSFTIEATQGLLFLKVQMLLALVGWALMFLQGKWIYQEAELGWKHLGFVGACFILGGIFIFKFGVSNTNTQTAFFFFAVSNLLCAAAFLVPTVVTVRKEVAKA